MHFHWKVWVPVFLVLAAYGSRLPAQVQEQIVHLEVALNQEDVVIDRAFLPPAQTPFTRIRLQSLEPVGLVDEPGYPRLPYLVRRIAVPAGSNVHGTSVNTGQVVSMGGMGFIEWAQNPRVGQGQSPPLPLPTGPDGSTDFLFYSASRGIPPDPTLAQVQVWPPQPVELIGTESEAGYDVYTFRIYPVQWYPAQDLVTITTTLSLDLSYIPGPPPIPTSYAGAMAVDGLRARVSNPGHILAVPRPLSFPAGPDTRYLIITDNTKWSPDFVRGASVGNLLDEFRRLAEWKSRKGVKASVVTVRDIVNGKYGDFVSGARDLQETIRSFLKFASREWSTYWVLLGGDMDIVPARFATAFIHNGDHYIWRDDSKGSPERAHCAWDSDKKLFRIYNHDKEKGIFDCSFGVSTILVSERTGRAYSKVAGIPGPALVGWNFTDETYSGATSFYSNYVVLGGADGNGPDRDLFTVQYNNSIPTDLYYASLEGPDYDIAGLHDWDKNDNGLYGQYRDGPGGASIDGINFRASVALGRAPASNVAEAKAFVDKVIAYESYEGVPEGFGRTLLLGSTNWGDEPSVSAGATDPPPEGSYVRRDGNTTARLHFKGAPEFSFSYTPRLIAWNESGSWYAVPYNLEASPTSLGYYFAASADYSGVSVLPLSRGFELTYLPHPTQYVVVRGLPIETGPRWYFFNNPGADGSVLEKEKIRTALGFLAPSVDLRLRLYVDILDTPDYPSAPADLHGLSGTSMKAALEDGFNLVSFSGHGYWTGCCGMNISWVPALTNGFAGGLVYADSCLTNQFDEPKALLETNDAVGERFVTALGGGAAAYIGNSRYSIIGVGPIFEQAFWANISVLRRLGYAHNSRGDFAATAAHRWINYSLNLMGDPEMSVWLKTPDHLSVAHEATVFRGDPLPVRVTGPGGAVWRAVACAMAPGGLYDVQETDPTGLATFSTAAALLGESISVTVTATGYIPYQGTVEVRRPPVPVGRADANLDGKLDISDAVTILSALFLGTEDLFCEEAADANADGKVDISDAVNILSFLFLGGQIASGQLPCL